MDTMNFPLILIFWFFSHINHTENGWKVHTIDASSSGADGVKLADINNDGLLDITTGWEEGGLTKIVPPSRDRSGKGAMAKCYCWKNAKRGRCSFCRHE